MSVNDQNPVQRMGKFSALLYYHLTKAMIEEYGDGAKEVIKRAIHAFGLERGRNIARRVTDAGLDLTIENLDKFYDMPIKEGWSPNAQYEGGKKYSRTEACVQAEVWKEKEWPEIGRLYCDVDLAIREGYNPNLSYTPKENILKGDSFCASVTEYKNKNSIK
jgi:hypothetical protein